MVYQGTSDATSCVTLPHLKILPFSADDYYVQLIIVKAQESVRGGTPRRLDQWRNVEQLCYELILYMPSEDNPSIPQPVTDLAVLWPRGEDIGSVQEFALSDILRRFDVFQTWLKSVRWKCEDDILSGICKDICKDIKQLREEIEVLKIEADIWDSENTANRNNVALRLRCSRMRDSNGRSIATSTEGGILTSFEVCLSLSVEKPNMFEQYYRAEPCDGDTADSLRPWTQGTLEVEGVYTLWSRMSY